MAYYPWILTPTALGYPTVAPFGGLRVDQSKTLVDAIFGYDTRPLFWETITAGGGSATHLPNESAVRLRCGTASGDKVTRQTYRYFAYQPGHGQRIEMTGVIGAAKSNVRQRLGYFDDNDGVFFEVVSTGIGVVQRSYTSGSAVDTRVAQSSWNIDKLDGTGASGITLDITKANIFFCDLEWLGVGLVRFGVVIDGVIRYCHSFRNANVNTTVYMTTAALPIRYEITNTGVAASQTDMYQICSTVKSEGGREELPAVLSRSNATTLRTVGAAEVPVLSIRPDTKWPAAGSLTNRKSLFPLSIDIYSDTAPIYWRLVFNPSSWTGASWVDHDTTHSGVEYDVSATAITGGLVIAEGWIATGSRGGADSHTFQGELAGTLDYAGTAQRGFAVCCTRVTNNSSSVGVAVQWKEI